MLSPAVIHRAFREAMKCAGRAGHSGEVPVGCVAVYKGRIIARDRNRIIGNRSAVAHAEMLVLQKVACILKNERLGDVELFVTLEPCLMCTGAIIGFRIPAVHFLAYDEKNYSMTEILRNPGINHRPEWYYYNNPQWDAAGLLKSFFASRRHADKNLSESL